MYTISYVECISLPRSSSKYFELEKYAKSLIKWGRLASAFLCKKLNRLGEVRLHSRCEASRSTKVWQSVGWGRVPALRSQGTGDRCDQLHRCRMQNSKDPQQLDTYYNKRHGAEKIAKILSLVNGSFFGW